MHAGNNNPIASLHHLVLRENVRTTTADLRNLSSICIFLYTANAYLVLGLAFQRLLCGKVIKLYKMCFTSVFVLI